MDLTDIGWWVDAGLWAAIILVCIAGVASLIMPLINSLSNPRALLKTLAGLGILAVIFLISWFVAGDEVTSSYISYNITTENASRLVGGGLMMMFVLFIIAVIGVVFSEIYKAITT